MMSTQPPDSATKTKSRRSLLPSLNFGSSSSSSSAASTASSSRAPPSASIASVSGAEPDYFATIHVPDANAPNPGAVRIASPFALATPLVSTSGARVSSRPTGADPGAQEPEPHPWAKLFPDGGMTTALPDGFRMARLGVPPTPAANPSSVPNKSQMPASGTSTPLDLRRNLNLPARLKGGLSSSSSLPLPSSSAASNTKANNASVVDLSKYKALDVDGLAEALTPPAWTQQSKASPRHASSATPGDVLILDIRPSTSFSMARIVSSINICAPSTLLKRPAITVERIEDEMLGSTSDRRRFMRWRKGPLKPKPDAKPGQNDEASLEAVRKRGATISLPEEPGVNKIIVLDTDTTRIDGTGNATAGGGGPCLIGVLKKFEAAGFAGELCWLVGGFNKLARSKKAQEFIDTGSPVHATEDESSSSADSTRTHSPADVHSRKPPTLKLNGVATIPSFGSPAEDGEDRKSLVQPRGLPMEAFQTQSTVAGWPGQSKSPAKDGSQPGAGDAFKLNLAGRQQTQNGNGAGNNVAAAASGANRPAAACANPFFDNIRQNRELQHGITEKIPMELPSMSESQLQQLPPFLQKLAHMSGADRAHVLAQAFFDVEKAEQHRLIATMQQHSAESDQDPRSKDFASAQTAALQRKSSNLSSRHLDPNSHAFPFSIAAALERGADNRYNNIWTYEHSRVRLSKPRSAHDPGSDYLNGSFVQPPPQLGSKRRYIATQAPLPSTFDAFWTAVWEQNSRVIVMLTREHESGRLQSHPYWLQSEFGGSIRLTKLEEVVLDDAGQTMRPEECSGILNKEQDGGALFPSMPAQPQQQGGGAGGSAPEPKREPTTVRRTFLLKNLAEPQSAPRRVVQLQYIAWPDYHIPETPESLLTLMDLADAAQNSADAEVRNSVTRRSGAATAGPMVVHCSAGVGRTGAFIVIDAALDVLRRARRRQKIAGNGGDAQAVGEPATWENNLVAASGSPMVDGTPEVDMAPPSSPLGDRFPRTPRRSLKRELSPTGMDIDSGSNSGRDLSSPPPMFRSRSNESGHGADAAGSLSSSIGSTGSQSKLAPGDAPMRSTQSMQPSSTGGDGAGVSSGFTNPFTSPSFRFNPAASARVRNTGFAMQNTSSHDSSILSPRRAQESSAGSSGFGSDPTLSPIRGATLQLGAQDAWRQASSPYSEVSTPSLHSGGSARSSFSSAAGVHSRLSSSNGLSPSGEGEAGRSIEEALLSAMNPFELALSQQSQSQNGEERSRGNDMPAAAGDTTTSTITGSNEPTPFEVSSSSASNTFNFTPHQRGESMSASNSAGSVSSFSDMPHHTPATSAHSTPANHSNAGQPESQVLLATDRTQLTPGSAGAAGAVDEAVANGDDVIKTIVEGVREQRMSLIQTGRQFVFVYSAVLAGLLRDLRNEGVV